MPCIHTIFTNIWSSQKMSPPTPFSSLWIAGNGFVVQALEQCITERRYDFDSQILTLNSPSSKRGKPTLLYSTSIFSNHSHLVPTAHFMVNFSLTNCSEDLLLFFAIYTRDSKKTWPQAAAYCALITITMSTLTILQHHAAPINYSGVVVVIFSCALCKKQGKRIWIVHCCGFWILQRAILFYKMEKQN